MDKIREVINRLEILEWDLNTSMLSEVILDLESVDKSYDEQIKRLRNALEKGIVGLTLAQKHNYKGGWCAVEERVIQARFDLEKALKEK